MYDNILNRLKRSKFRSSFHLNKKMIIYVEEKGLDKIKDHAYDFITKRLKSERIENDGKQDKFIPCLLLNMQLLHVVEDV